MKSLCRISFSVCASLCLAFFLSSCALGLEPAKSSSGTTVSLHLSSLASAVTGRAIIQGSGYLYIQTGSTAADAKLYGPWQTGSGELFSTSEVPSGEYDSFTIIYLDSPVLGAPVSVDETNNSILSALQNRLSDHPDTLSSCSIAALSGVSIRSNRDNPIEATLVPATMKSGSLDLGIFSNTDLDSATGSHRVFFKLSDIRALDMYGSGHVLSTLSFILSSSSVDGAAVQRLAFYGENGKPLVATDSPLSVTPSVSLPWNLSVNPNESVSYVYVEYSGRLSLSCQAVYDNTSRTVWYASESGTGDGSDASHPCTLEQAVQGANASTGTGTRSIILTGDVTVSAASSLTFQKDTLLTSAGGAPHTIKAGSSSATVSFTVGDTTAASVTFSNCVLDGAGSNVAHLVTVAKGTFTLGTGATLQNNASSSSGGGVYVSGSTATFALAGGTISSCSTSSSGGAVYMSGGTFTMSGGTISSCSASTSGGAVYMSGGMFTMSSGTITGCTALNGGAVGMTNGTFTMSDGKIDNCSNSSSSGVGGGVYISSSGTMNMNGGTISACTSQSSGGGVYVYSGAFALKGGTIKSCKASGSMSSGGQGGGIHLNGGTVTIDSGLISACTASGMNGNKGGGLYIASGNASFSGGIISKCGATEGGAMYLTGGTTNFATSSNVAKLSFSGNVAPGSNNIYKFSSAATITVDGSAPVDLTDFGNKTGFAVGDITWN